MGCLSEWSVVLVGGDARERILADEIRTAGGDVVLFGHAGETADELHVAVRGRWVVAPVSGIGPGGLVKGPGGSIRILPEVANHAQGVVAGAIDEAWAANLRVPVVAYRERDAFAWANAVPTAEGALAWALNADGHILHDAWVGVTGFGRVAQILAPRLAGIGCRLRVLARDPAERAHAKALGYGAAPVAKEPLTDLAVLFNTIPSVIFDAEVVEVLPQTTLVLDLASPPGGFTPGARAVLEGRLAWHPSLPGEIAPASAAAIILETLEQLCPTLHGDARGRTRSASFPG